MTEETTKTEAPIVHTADTISDPAERAIANGYIEPEPPTREARAKALIEAVEHAHRSNSPLGLPMIAELKDLLGEGGHSDLAEEKPAEGVTA